MGDEGIHLSRAVIYEGAGGQRKGVAGIDHVVYEDRHLVPNIADEDLHLLRPVRVPLPLAVDQRELDPELVRNGRHPSVGVSMPARGGSTKAHGDCVFPPARTYSPLARWNMDVSVFHMPLPLARAK